jgi:hypothetical protein
MPLTQSGQVFLIPSNDGVTKIAAAGLTLRSITKNGFQVNPFFLLCILPAQIVSFPLIFVIPRLKVQDSTPYFHGGMF